MTVLQVETLETSFATSLRHDIIAGIIPGGTELRSRELAVRFGISSSPVLAGLKRLEAEGFVEISDRGVALQLGRTGRRAPASSCSTIPTCGSCTSAGLERMPTVRWSVRR
jgi:DNA-binding transcriptional MocR family regulator